MYDSVGQYVNCKSKEYRSTYQETNWRKKRSYVFRSQGEYVKAEDSARKSLEMSEDIGDRKEQPLLAEFWRLCIYLVLNMSRLQSPTRSHFQSWKRDTSQTEGSKLLIHELRNGASKFEWTWKCLAVLWESTCDQTKKQAIEEKVIVTKNRDVYVFYKNKRW